MGRKLEPDLWRDKPSRPNKRLKLTLPLPPSVNSMYHNTKFGGKVLTKVSEQYIRKSRAIINEAIEEQKWKKQSEKTWFYVDIVVYMPDRKIRDSHNMLKLLLDVMQGVTFNNDYYAMPRIQAVEYDKDNPRIELVLRTQDQLSRQKGIKMVN